MGAGEARRLSHGSWGAAVAVKSWPKHQQWLPTAGHRRASWGVTDLGRIQAAFPVQALWPLSAGHRSQLAPA